jgi:hypothetical protein
MAAGSEAANQPPPSLDAGLVHALSNHLSIILGFVDLVIADVPATHPRHRDLIEIREAALQAAKLIGREPPPSPGRTLRD